MKKYIVIVILIGTLFMGQSVQAEDTTKAPIMPRKPKNGTYTLAEAEKFILTDTGSVGKIAKWWRTNALAIINEGLAAAGETLELKEENFHWMYQNGHITHEFKDLDPYINSRLSNGIPEWFNDVDGWSGEVGVFRYGNCTIILYKSGCMNLLDIPAFILTKKSPPPANRKDTTVVVNGQPITISITNTNTNTNTNDVPQTGGVQERVYVVGQPYPTQTINPRRGYYQTRSNFNFGIRASFNNNSRGRGRQRVIESRTMPGAIDAGAGGNGGGLDADTRGMPGAINR